MDFLLAPRAFEILDSGQTTLMVVVWWAHRVLFNGKNNKSKKCTLSFVYKPLEVLFVKQDTSICGHSPFLSCSL